MPDKDWFTVHKEGLADVLERRGRWFAVYELIQNAIDEDGVTTVNVTLDPIPDRRGVALLTVEDNAPEGFHDLTHAFTLFAPSKKKGDAEKRGRFNLGEKLVLAICDQATIISTKGGYQFGSDGRKRLRKTTETGSKFTGVIRMTRQQVEETSERVFSIFPPDGVTVVYNGQEIPKREPIHTFVVSLPTEIAGDDGKLRPTDRKTQVRVYDPVGDETPAIYEMNIPVVEIDGRWHIDVGQKVPLNSDRDNVTPSYLRKLNAAVVNKMHALLTDDDATSTWVRDAIGSPEATPEAVQKVVTTLYGTDAVIYDPSDPEANKIAHAEGRSVIHGGAFDKRTWENIRTAGFLRPAGKVTPSNSTIFESADGIPPIEDENYTEAMHKVAVYASEVALVALGRSVHVEVYRMPISESWRAAYRPGKLSFNLTRLGNRFFNEPDIEEIDALLIHEFGHEYASDHLSSEYYNALCTVGARMKAQAARLEGFAP